MEAKKFGNSHRRIVFLKTPAAFNQHNSFPTRQSSLRKKREQAHQCYKEQT